MADVLTNGRPAGDVLSRVVRVTLSGQEFVLPVRSIRFNREWKEHLDARTVGIVDELAAAGDDIESVLKHLDRDVDPFIDLLTSYAPDVLNRDIIEAIEPDPSMDVVNACQEVWLAASPLVAIGIESLMTSLTSGLPATDGSPPTSSPPPSTAGPRRTSRTRSQTSSSSRTSTRLRTGSSAAQTTGSRP